MDDIQAALDASDEPLSLGVLKEELNQFQDAYNALLKKQSKMQGIDVLNFQENNDQEVKNLLTVT